MEPFSITGKDVQATISTALSPAPNPYFFLFWRLTSSSTVVEAVSGTPRKLSLSRQFRMW